MSKGFSLILGFLFVFHQFCFSNDFDYQSDVVNTRSKVMVEFLENKLFADGGSMSGFGSSTKLAIKCIVMGMPPEDSKRVTNLFDKNGSMLGFTEDQKLEVFRRVSIDQSNTQTAYNLLHTYDYNGVFHHFSAVSKMRLLELSKMDFVAKVLWQLMSTAQPVDETRVLTTVEEVLNHQQANRHNSFEATSSSTENWYY